MRGLAEGIKTNLFTILISIDIIRPMNNLTIMMEVKYSRINHQSDLLSDIRSVGSTKSVGYLPLSTIKEPGGNVKMLSAEAKRKGFIVRLYRKNEAPIVS